MLDRFNRKINYLRISVTDRCNLRCIYCVTGDKLKLLPKEKILSYEEISEVVEVGAGFGIDKIRLTGGEPLVRIDIVRLVEMISRSGKIKDISMTTNGMLLDSFAKPLAEAGLQRVNISLDTIDPEKFRRLTCRGDINKVFAGIEAAKKYGLSPIKVNCVVKNNSDEPNASQVKEYCLKNELQPRFIKQMDLRTGVFSTVEGGIGGNCFQCNRLRLTSDGKIKPCLFSDIEFDIKEFGIKKAFELALEAKPKQGSQNHKNVFSNIGG